jgi:hypothetical protein
MLISRFAHLEARSHAYRERVPGDYVTGTYACMPRRARQGLEGEGKVGAVSPFGRLKASLSPLTSKRGPSHCLRCQFDHPSRFLQRVDKQVFFGAREKDMVSTRCMLPLARVQSKRLMMVGKIRQGLQFVYSVIPSSVCRWLLKVIILGPYRPHRVEIRSRGKRWKIKDFRYA